MRLAAAAAAGFTADAMAEAKVGATVLVLSCLGFFVSRLPRRCFMDMGGVAFWRRGGENPCIVGPWQTLRPFPREVRLLAG